MMILGTVYNMEMEFASPEGLREWGYPMEPSTPARKVCPNNG